MDVTAGAKNFNLHNLLKKQQHSSWKTVTKKRMGMFTKTRKVNKVEVKRGTIIPALIYYLIQCFSTIIHSYKNFAYFLNKLKYSKFFLLCDNGQFCIFLLQWAKNSYIYQIRPKAVKLALDEMNFQFQQLIN